MSGFQSESEVAVIRSVGTDRVVVRSLPAPGARGAAGAFSVADLLQLEITTQYPNSYREVTRIGERVMLVTTWESAAKAVKIFTKSFEYNLSGKVTVVQLTYVPTGSTSTKTLTYNTFGQIISVTRLFSA